MHEEIKDPERFYNILPEINVPKYMPMTKEEKGQVLEASWWKGGYSDPRHQASKALVATHLHEWGLKLFGERVSESSGFQNAK